MTILTSSALPATYAILLQTWHAPCCSSGMIEGIFSNSNYQAACKMLDYNALRHEALAGNLANIEVPGYKRMDVSSASFQDQLSKAMRSGSAQSIKAITPVVGIDLATPSSRCDGNNVEMDRELMEINRNELEYEYITRYMNHDYQLLRTAISTQV